MKRFGAIIASAAITLTSLTSTQAAVAAETSAWDADAARIALPETIPSLDNFAGAESGTWTLSDGARIVTTASEAKRAEMLSTELTAFLGSAVPSVVGVEATSADVSLVLDPTATELGDEGFSLDIGEDGLVVKAAKDAGIFYGTRTVSQLLRQESRGDLQLTLPAGSATSVPKYAERGAILCACQINISPEWIDQFLDDVADLHINQILMEMKVKSDSYTDTNTWGYYTKADVAAFVAKAEALNIDVIPEINSPGHMGIWLENSPQYQLVDVNGTYKPEMLDISNEAAREMVKTLIDEYDGVFESDYWHMGADEYTIGTNYAMFPQLTEYAQATFGPTATANDAFNAFINEINEHVKEKGKTLRVFNDGVNRSASQKIDQDVIVDYWVNKSFYTPQQFVEDGYSLMNTTQSLYWSRQNVYGVNTQNLYNSSWNVGTFDGNQQIDPDYEGLLGARVSLWPDNSLMTENEVKMQTRDSIAFLAQMTWSASRPWPQWQGDDGMGAAVQRIGWPEIRSTVPEPTIPNGTYTIPDLDSVGKGPWQFTETYDGYYQIKDTATAQCLTIDQDSAKHLSVVTEVGAPAVLDDCQDISVQYSNRSSALLPHQKWQARVLTKTVDGENIQGVLLRNAVTLQYLAVVDGSEQHVDIQGVSDPAVISNPAMLEKSLSGTGNHVAAGTVAQLPHDLVEVNGNLAAKAIFAIASVKGISTDVTSVSDVNPKQPVNITATVAAEADENAPASKVKVTVSEGWAVAPAEIELDSVPMGGTAEAIFQIANTTATEGTATFTWEVGDETYSTTVSLNGTLGPRLCGAGFEDISTSSEERGGEGLVSGYINAAFDTNADGTANLDTFWHTRWSSGTDRFPFWVVFNPTAALDGKFMSTIEYAPRQNKVNGRIKDYNVYLSATPKVGTDDWGDPVVSGQLQSTTDWQAISMPANTEGQYVKFEITDVWDEVAGKQDEFASAAGFCVSTVEQPVELVAPAQPENPVVTGDEKPTVLPVEADERVIPITLGLGADGDTKLNVTGTIGEMIVPIAIVTTVDPELGYTLSFETLPAGLTYDASVGAIVGAPVGEFTGDVIVTLTQGTQVKNVTIRLAITEPADSVPPVDPAGSANSEGLADFEGSESATSPGTQNLATPQDPVPAETDGLAKTGADLAWAVGAVLVLLLGGLGLVMRRRQA